MLLSVRHRTWLCPAVWSQYRPCHCTHWLQCPLYMELVSRFLQFERPSPQLLTASAVYRNPIYHQVIFAMLVLTTAIRIHHLLRRSDASRRIPQEVKAEIGNTFATGTGLFVFGFFIWNLDNIFCAAITRQKVAIGWPVAFLLEGAIYVGTQRAALTLNCPGHAWWHFFTVSRDE